LHPFFPWEDWAGGMQYPFSLFSQRLAIAASLSGSCQKEREREKEDWFVLIFDCGCN